MVGILSLPCGVRDSALESMITKLSQPDKRKSALTHHHSAVVVRSCLIYGKENIHRRGRRPRRPGSKAVDHSLFPANPHRVRPWAGRLPLRRTKSSLKKRSPCFVVVLGNTQSMLCGRRLARRKSAPEIFQAIFWKTSFILQRSRAGSFPPPKAVLR